jgi:hypothetical protein
VQSVGSESRLFRVIEGAAWHRHSARFDSFAGANSDGQSSGNRLVNVTTPTTARGAYVRFGNQRGREQLAYVAIDIIAAVLCRDVG